VPTRLLLLVALVALPWPERVHAQEFDHIIAANKRLAESIRQAEEARKSREETEFWIKLAAGLLPGVVAGLIWFWKAHPMARSQEPRSAYPTPSAKRLTKAERAEKRKAKRAGRK